MFSQRLIGPVRTGDMATEDIDIFDLSATAPVYKKNFAEGGEAKTVDPNVQEVKEILKSAGINKLYQAADSLGIRLPDGIGVDSAADVITNELLLRANIPVRKKDDTLTLEKSLGKGISFRADVNPKQKSGFLNISGRFNEGGIATKDIDIFDEEPSGVQKISKLISDGQVREAYSEFEDLPLAQQLTVSVTPVIGDALAAYEVGEFGTRAKESLSRGSPLGAAGNAALAGLAGLSFIPLLRALRGARPIGKLLKKSDGLESLSNIKDQNKRLLRAADQGFDVDNVFYHATDKFEGLEELDFDTLKPSTGGKIGPGVYVAKTPEYSERYIRTSYQSGTEKPLFGEGSRIMPVFVRGKIGNLEDYGRASDKAKDLLRKEFSAIEAVRKNNKFDEIMANRKKLALQKKKAQEILSEEGFSGFGVSDEVVIFDPSDIRSVNATFDPTTVGSAGLLKAKGGIVSLFN